MGYIVYLGVMSVWYVNSVVSTSRPGGPCDEEGDVSEGDVALPRTGSDKPVNSVVSTIGPGGPGDAARSVADAPGDSCDI